MTDRQAAEELSRIRDEAEWLDLTAREILALDRAIYVLMHETELPWT